MILAVAVLLTVSTNGCENGRTGAFGNKSFGYSCDSLFTDPGEAACFEPSNQLIALDRIAVGSEFYIVWTHYSWALSQFAFSPDTNLYPATPVNERAATIEGPFTMLAIDSWEENTVIDFVHLNAVEPTHLAAEASLDDDARSLSRIALQAPAFSI